MKQSLIFSACSLVLFIVGCKGTVEVNCTEEPTRRSCVEACTDDPTLSHCSPGEDAGPDARMVDAGPDVPSSNCTTPCEGETPVCDEDNSVCVQCLAPVDCEGVEGRPMCVDNACVECTGNEECTDAGASVCSTTGDTAGTCVPCAAATSGVDCEGVVEGETALNVCDESGESPVCVQCNASDESACDPNVCDVLARTCADDTPVGMAATCAPCVSDSQCAPGQTCAPTTFDEMDAGYYCLWDLDAPTSAPGACPLPFATINGVETIGDHDARSCQLGLSTCAAHNDFRTPGREDMNCNGSMSSEADADCGDPTLEDGFCITNEATARDRCTVQCGAADDCVIDGTCYACPAAMPGETRVCGFTPVACP